MTKTQFIFFEFICNAFTVVLSLQLNLRKFTTGFLCAFFFFFPLFIFPSLNMNLVELLLPPLFLFDVLSIFRESHLCTRQVIYVLESNAGLSRRNSRYEWWKSKLHFKLVLSTMEMHNFVMFFCVCENISGAFQDILIYFQKWKSMDILVNLWHFQNVHLIILMHSCCSLLLWFLILDSCDLADKSILHCWLYKIFNGMASIQKVTVVC